MGRSLVVLVSLLVSVHSLTAMEKLVQQNTVKAPVATRLVITLLASTFVSQETESQNQCSIDGQKKDSVSRKNSLNATTVLPIPGKQEMAYESPRKTVEEIVSSRPLTPFAFSGGLSMPSSPEPARIDREMLTNSFEQCLSLASCYCAK